MSESLASVDEPVEVVDWNPAWPAEALRLIAHCATVLEPRDIVVIEHIGSTAVPGLPAKPVIDLLVGVRPGRRLAAAAALAAAGWTHLGDAGVVGREYLRRREGQHANVHVVEHGSGLWSDNIALRDHLREDATARDRYAKAKRAAVADAPMLLAYSERKQSTLRELLDEARCR